MKIQTIFKKSADVFNIKQRISSLRDGTNKCYTRTNQSLCKAIVICRLASGQVIDVVWVQPSGSF